MLLILWIGNSLGLRSQTSNDTLCFPVQTIRKVLIAASQKKVADSLLVIAEKQVAQLQNTITLLGEKDAEQKEMYDNQLDLLRQEITLYKDQISGYERLVRKERRKRRWATAGGILTTGVITYFLITK